MTVCESCANRRVYLPFPSFCLSWLSAAARTAAPSEILRVTPSELPDGFCLARADGKTPKIVRSTAREYNRHFGGPRPCPKDQSHRVAPRVSFQSAFEKSAPGSTGDPPVPSGDPPDGTGVTARANETGRLTRQVSAVPVGGSPTGAGGSPAPPIFKTRSPIIPKRFVGVARVAN